MPTLSNSNLPTPRSWDEFEEITLDALKIKWENPELARHGRNGQAQAGVDIYGENNFFFFAGVQCKKFDSNLTIETVEEEIEKAEKFDPQIEIFYIATSLPTDAKLQKAIRIISKKRKDGGKFPIGIFFWNDIVQELVSNENVFKKHFPQFNIGNNKSSERRKLFSILDLSFHGLNIKHYCEVIYGEFGMLANEDPRQIEIIFSIIKSAAMVVCTSEEQEQLKAIIKEFTEYVIPHVTGAKQEDFHWSIALNIAKRIEGQISSIDHALIEKELMVFKIGEQLAIWNKYEFDKTEPNEKINTTFRENLQKLIKRLNDDILPSSINELFEKYENGDDWIQSSIANKFYNKLRQNLIEAELFDN